MPDLWEEIRAPMKPPLKSECDGLGMEARGMEMDTEEVKSKATSMAATMVKEAEGMEKVVATNHF